MKDYQTELKNHLTIYARERLKLTEPGEWCGRRYDHILPAAQWALNFLPHCREALCAYLDKEKRIKRHQYFHHLSSSQAFAFNLFHPFCDGGAEAEPFFRHFGAEPGPGERCRFEVVPDTKEKTNVDVAWDMADGGTLYCEVKLSESEFGTAGDLPQYHDKLEKTYRRQLELLVPSALLEPSVFFRHYQILRNVWLLHDHPRHRLAFLLPRKNLLLWKPLNTVLDVLAPEVRARIQVVEIERLLTSVQTDDALPLPLREHFAAVAQKYLPDFST